jgi:hypothetical protein
VTADGDLDTAMAGQPVTLTLADEVDVSRGDVIVPAADTIQARTRVTARVLWMEDGRLTKGASLIVKLASATANARMAVLNHAIDIHSFEPRAADSLVMNEIGVIDLVFDKPLVVTDYQTDRELGAFVLINRLTNQTVALGVIEPDPVDATSSLWRQVGQRVGAAIGVEHPGLWQSVASRVVGAAVLAGLVLALSYNIAVAACVAAAEIFLCPAVGRVVRSAWPILPSANRSA